MFMLYSKTHYNVLSRNSIINHTNVLRTCKQHQLSGTHIHLCY